MKLFLAVCLSLAGICLGGKYTRTVSYQDEVLVKCSGLQRDAIQHLVEADGVDVWHVGVSGSIDFRVKSEEFQEMKQHLPECSEEGSVEELVRKMELEMEKKYLNKTQLDWFEEYHRYDEIVDWWSELAMKNTEIVKYEESVGKSYEGRDIPAVHITADLNRGKVIYFQCQIHAREWISGASCMYVANELVERYNNGDQLIKDLLNQVEIVYIPIVNPDGYEYTWTSNRLWRKNRRPGPLGICDGVDLNRNYNDHWGGGGSSGNECSETYRGTSAASEQETQTIAAYFKSLGNIVGAIDWHSFSQLILRPYGWTTARSPDEDQLKELGDQMSADILAVEEMKYTSQRSIDLYMTTGSASDWFYSDNANENNEFRAAGFTIELRDTGRYGFVLPPDQIIPTGKELMPAVIRFAEELQAKPLTK